MYFIESDSSDAAHNLALEHYVFEKLDRSHDYFLLWQSDNAVIVGKHQNALAEINASYVKQHGIKVVRRLSGGGAVYHDLGNFNFTFIINGRDLATVDLNTFCSPLVRALNLLGVRAELNQRHDMLLDGKKISGTAQYCRQGRIMHHGTLLYDSDLGVLEKALTPRDNALESKAIKSVRSPVANIRSAMPQDMPPQDFKKALRGLLVQSFSLNGYTLSEADFAAIEALRERQYESWDWNYGASPAFTLCRKVRTKDWGELTVCARVDKGRLQSVEWRAGALGDILPDGFSQALTGCRFEEEALGRALAALPLPENGPGAASLLAGLFA